MTNTDNINNAKTDVAAALQAGVGLAGLAAVVQVLTVAGANRPFLLKPKDLDLQDFEKWLPAPAGLRQKVNVLTPDALIDYIKLFGVKDRTVVFADKPNGAFTAILDYHAAPDQPSWNQHQAVCTLTHTQAWVEWTANDRKSMNQTDFSAFLEEHIPEIVTPDGATLVELARTFEAKKIVQFKSHQRAADGSIAFLFDEDVQGSHKAGTVKVPAEFVIKVAPYEGAKMEPIAARLRYRLNNSNLSLSYEMVRPIDVLNRAFAEQVAHIAERTVENCRKVIYGTA